MKSIPGRLGDDVARRRAVWPVGFEHVAQGIDGAAQCGRRGVRRAVWPQNVDEHVRRNGTRALRDQYFEQLPRLTRVPITFGDSQFIAFDLKGAKCEDLDARSCRIGSLMVGMSELMHGVFGREIYAAPLQVAAH